MEIKKVLIEIFIIAVYWGIEWLIGHLFHLKNYYFKWVWTLLLMAIAEANLGFYWFAYPVIVWMVIGIGLVFIQLGARKEFIYQRYWPAFWRISFFLALLVSISSLFAMNLAIP